MTVFFSGGIGDVFAVEAHLSTEFKWRVKKIILATPAAEKIKEVFALHSYFSAAKVEILFGREECAAWSNSRYAFHTLAETLQAVGRHGNITQKKIIEENPQIVDLSIAIVFPFIKSGHFFFNRSEVIYPAPPFDCKGVLAIDAATYMDTRIPNRNFSEREIYWAEKFAEKKGLRVVRLDGDAYALCDALAITAAADYFIGIDSMLSVYRNLHTAAGGRTLVKSVNSHLMRWIEVYYPRPETRPTTTPKIDAAALAALETV